MALIFMACSLGYCINFLKKKKSAKIEAWKKAEREKEEKREEKRNRRRERSRSRGKKRDRKLKSASYKAVLNPANDDHEPRSDTSDCGDEHQMNDGITLQ